MSHQIEIHSAQTAIMRALLFAPSKRFTELQKETGLGSKHANFHIKRLIELGYIVKLDDGSYALSQKGKEHSNRLDTDTNTIERQPKVSVVVILERTNKDGEREFLWQQRLKNPYYGFWGRLGGKVRWGESLPAAAARELLEETGLTADFEFATLFHKRDFTTGTTDILEDKMFMIMKGVNVSGELVVDHEGGKNEWMTLAEFKTQDKYFESAYEFQQLVDDSVPFIEKDYYYTKDEY